MSTTACKLPAALLTPAGALSLGSRVPRQYHEVCVWDDKLWVMEGCYHELASESMAAAIETGRSWNMKDVWYSSDGVSWTELPDTPWAPRHAASPFVYDDALWMVAGNNMKPDVWRLDRT